jgi:hypothetical protein
MRIRRLGGRGRRTNLNIRVRDGCQCRRKIEMSPGVQSRDDTRVPDGHEEERLGLHLGRGVDVARQSR